ncbi:DNA polymerase III subunit gamma/tau [Candidatus Dependentiae bacterium]|nr:DNA polymerase III subunit gamma/tau [Candidatus Dependentiae bacterium]MBU4387425.1 DNA polymerase III subunit gamma/tau [Candidatus Dependentiae bacterium]MCG2756756.1 DNA polymerase III subunit gamma/tau [Candidatus Dependentiae bacterium]
MDPKNTDLNLARKHRPKTFSDVVGQEISIKILLNSLYLEKLFPVYLFAGQRGCGKTSTARIFAAAINCQNIENFKKNPKENSIPCLNCESCKAMLNASHPDFIEIDAASHTGVENVRQILESCAYMPVLGRKKIYLIDEAHMLSKAAFNAFLKILEEPPVSALFILATTEIQKFPATVLSRCFQLIFKSINNDDLKKHMLKICSTENINIDENAADLLIQETQGSVRDALNMLEQVRFSQEKISLDLLLKILGKISESEILDLIEIVANGESKKLFPIFESKINENINTQALWDMLVQTIRTLVWIKFGSTKLPIYFNDIQRLNDLAAKFSINDLNHIFKLMWEQEEIFLKTTNKQIFLELLLLEMSQKENKIGNNENFVTKKEQVISTNIIPKQNKELTPNNKAIEPKKENTDNTWIQFVEKINAAGNPFLSSVLSNAKFVQFNPTSKKVEIILVTNNIFMQATINENKSIWQSILNEYYPMAANFEFLESKIIQDKIIEKQEIASDIKPISTQSKINSQTNTINTEKWPTTSLIQNYFPGKIKQGDESK